MGKPGLHLSQLENGFRLQIEPKNCRMNFQHIPFNARILSLQAMPFPWLLKHKGVYLQNPIIPFSFLLPQRERRSQKMHTHKVAYSLISMHIYLYIVYIYSHTHAGFLPKNCSHLNIWQSRRQLCIQKQWRSVENRARLRGTLQPRQLVSAKDSLHPQENQRCLLPVMTMKLQIAG